MTVKKMIDLLKRVCPNSELKVEIDTTGVDVAYLSQGASRTDPVILHLNLSMGSARK